MKKILYVLLLCLIGTVGISNLAYAQGTFATRVVKDSLFIPWEILYGPDGNIWFTQKNGYVCRLDPATGVTDTLYHETNVVPMKEGGMLGMALHPDFPNTPYLYAAYEYQAGALYIERVVRYTYANNTLQSPMVLVDSITGADYHNGCRLLIVDDKLFITVGDATNQSNPQNLSSINGKTLRINLDGSIPTDNPIAGSRLWTWGHRNPQGLVYANNRLYSSEHGDNTDDEINIISKGRNYGWPNVAGYCNTGSEMTFCADSNVVEPIQAWTPTIAPSGIDYYEAPMFPAWQHSLLLATLKDEHLYQLKLNNAGDSVVNATVVSGVNFGRLRDVCISPDGKVYISTSNSDPGDAGLRIDRIIELYDSTFVTAVENVTQNSLRVFPNPVHEVLHLQWSTGLATQELLYTIVDMQGRILKTGSLPLNQQVDVSMAGLSAGVYFLKTYMGTAAYLKAYKLVKY